jgi:molybdate transport system substrate-binding protein
MRWLRPIAVLALAGALIRPAAADEAATKIYAAGSLRGALNDIADAFKNTHGSAVETIFGPSGVLREQLASGESSDVFASADMAQPLALEAAGKSGPVVMFARNRLCALVRPNLAVTPDILLSAMLDPKIRLATSTPKADPAGDYAWAIFAKAEAIAPGSRAQLDAKALKLVGNPDAPQPPAGRNAYAWHLGEGHADIFLSYCTNRAALAAELPGSSTVELPPGLATGADYGLTILTAAPSPRGAGALVLFILSRDGQAILRDAGFDAPLAASP